MCAHHEGDWCEGCMGIVGVGWCEGVRVCGDAWAGVKVLECVEILSLSS